MHTCLDLEESYLQECTKEEKLWRWGINQEIMKMYDQQLQEYKIRLDMLRDLLKREWDKVEQKCNDKRHRWLKSNQKFDKELSGATWINFI